MQCPFCGSKHEFPEEGKSFETFFPKNDFVVNMIVDNAGFSPCFNCPKNLFCVDKKCQKFTKFCVRCHQFEHSDCGKDCAMSYESAKYVYKFIVPDLETVFPVLEIKMKVKNQIDELHKTIDKLIDEFAESYANEFNWLKAAKNDVLAFKLDINVFDLERSKEKESVMEVRASSAESVFESARYVADRMTREIWNEFRRSLEKMILNETELLARFNAGCMPRLRKFLYSFENKNRKLFVDLVSDSQLIGPKFEMNSYLESLTLPPIFDEQNFGFQLTSSHNVESNTCQSFWRFVHEAFAQPKLIRAEIEDHISASLKSQTNENWHVLLECSQMSRYKPYHKKFLSAEKNGYTLCAYVI